MPLGPSQTAGADRWIGFDAPPGGEAFLRAQTAARSFGHGMPALREKPGVRERSFRPSQRANPARVPVPYFGYTYGNRRLLLSLPQPAFVSCNWLQRHRNKKQPIH